MSNWSDRPLDEVLTNTRAATELGYRGMDAVEAGERIANGQSVPRLNREQRREQKRKWPGNLRSGRTADYTPTTSSEGT